MNKTEIIQRACRNLGKRPTPKSLHLPTSLLPHEWVFLGAWPPGQTQWFIAQWTMNIFLFKHHHILPHLLFFFGAASNAAVLLQWQWLNDDKKNLDPVNKIAAGTRFEIFWDPFPTIKTAKMFRVLLLLITCACAFALDFSKIAEEVNSMVGSQQRDMLYISGDQLDCNYTIL